MKRLLSVIFLIFALAPNSVFADSIKVIPQELTRKETEDFISVNEASSAVFRNLKMKIKTSGFAETYNDFPLMNDEYYTNDNYYYTAKNPSIILIYEKESKKLEYISVKKANIPYICAFYEYPSGELKYVKIWENKTEWYMFNAKGEYISYEPYIKAIRRSIFDSMKIPSRRTFAHKLNNQDIQPVRVAVSLDKEGNLKKVELIEKSNVEEINKAVIDAVNAAAPFKSFPQIFESKYITVMFKFNF